MPIASRADDIRLSAEEVFDLAIIGGGINGAAIAWEAASRGLNVVLLEKGDFGAATSSGCFKIVHGGLRYLQHLNFSRMKESMQEQRNLRRIAPYLVEPFPFVVPCSGFGRKSKWFLNFGVSFYEALNRERNDGVADDRVIPSHKVLTPEQALQMAPGLKHEGLSGAVLYYDCQMTNCERLTLAFVMSAVRQGAIALNYVAAEKFIFTYDDEGVRRIQSVECRDQESGKQFSIKASYVINATGPWAKVLFRKFCLGHKKEDICSSSDSVFSKGIQAVVPDCGLKAAVVVESEHSDQTAIVSRGKRSYFLVPWRNQTLIGTADEFFQGNPDEFKITSTEVERLIDEVSSGYQDKNLAKKMVRLSFGGLRLVDREVAQSCAGSFSGTVPASQYERVVDHAIWGDPTEQVKNLMSIEGVKYTTARSLAEEVINRLAIKLFSVLPSKTATAPLYGALDGGIAEHIDFINRESGGQNIDRLIAELVADYGTVTISILQLIEEDPFLAERLSPAVKTRCAEIVHSVRNERALHLSDVVCRRTPLGQAGYPGDQALEQAANIMAAELSWDEVRKQQEIALTKGLFKI